MFNICVLPQLTLLSIEAIQFYERGREYWDFWNIIDLTQITTFFTIWKIVVFNATEPEFLPFLKLANISLSCIKFIHFVSAYTEFGFFVTMLTVAVIDLKPFLVTYVFFQFLFTMMFAVMKVQIDDDLSQAKYLGNIGRLFLEIWRNSTGKLAFVRYDDWYLNEEGFKKNMAIVVIYFVFNFQILFMFIVMLNFMIAIIDQTYKAVIKHKKRYVYRNKAELNQECF